ncbi:UDP-N-acetylmuramyl-tripeptide synthetase [Candidatus Parcubacteria bacterium]|nr:MAG: UDP-N-acetylmuramyl-tripeptide synthetase [Candidatus Parcubacteria bacterium]
MFLENAKKLPGIRALHGTPRLMGAYHFFLAWLGAVLYGFPSRELVVIGVTGTKGKSTTCDIIAQILRVAGFRVGMVTTVRIWIGDEERENLTKQTMPGRFALQKLLREMVRAGCGYAVIETSSEGILQYRHRFIDYRIGVFTNLSPEHIERHGGLENYRAAKVELFRKIARHPNGVGIYNLDDPSVGYFLKPGVGARYGFTFKKRGENEASGLAAVMRVTDARFGKEDTSFSLNKVRFTMPLVGEFNLRNAAAAACAAISQGVPLPTVQKALGLARSLPGRLERVDLGQRFTVIIDYAHEPSSLESIYRAARLFRPKQLICLLGSQGGGRDRAKREIMGRVAGTHCDSVVLTNEDPYDEDPMKIIGDIKSGVLKVKRAGKEKIFAMPDRREGIRRALSLARIGDAVVLTGKGGEAWMCLDGGRMIPWNERKVVEEELELFLEKKGRSGQDRPRVSGLG